MIKTVRLSRVKLKCHELARDSYAFSRRLKIQLNIHQLNPEFVMRSQLFEPLHVTKSSEGIFSFFAGWRWFEIAQSSGQQELTIIQHNEIELNEINHLAWLYLLSSNITNLERKTGLRQLTEIIGRIPLKTRKKLLENQHSYSTIASLINITNQSRGVIRSQLGNKAKNENNKTGFLMSQLIGD